MLAIVVAGLAAWGTLWLIQGSDHGYGAIPSSAVKLRDYASAVLLGAIAVGVGALLRRLVRRLATVTENIDERAPWWVAAAVFGTVLGVLYLIGGQSVQFSGSEGSKLLLSGELHYSTWALAGIALVKLLATSWSLAAGYRGGLVFPSVFAGIAVSLFVAAADPNLSGSGVLLGSVAGLLVEMSAPIPGVIMLLALLPAKLLPLGLVGGAAAIAARALVTRLRPARRPGARLAMGSAIGWGALAASSLVIGALLGVRGVARPRRRPRARLRRRRADQRGELRPRRGGRAGSATPASGVRPGRRRAHLLQARPPGRAQRRQAERRARRHRARARRLPRRHPRAARARHRHRRRRGRLDRPPRRRSSCPTCPRPIGSSTEMRAAGRRRPRSAGCGSASRSSARWRPSPATRSPTQSGNVHAAVDGFAAGALLVMLIDSMIPEAVRKGGDVSGLVTVLGFAVAAGLSSVS